MEKIIKVEESSEFSYTNVPKHLTGIEVGDVIRVTSFPAGRKHGKMDKYMNGVTIRIDEGAQNGFDDPENPVAYLGFEYLSETPGFENTRTYRTIRNNGYVGDIEKLGTIQIFADMVEFDVAKVVEVVKGDPKISYSITCKKKDPAIIAEMISKIDRERLVKIFSIALGRGQKPKEGAVDKWLDKWANAKYEFYLAFGHQLSISSRHSYQMDAADMRGMVYDMYRQYPKYAATLDLISESKSGIDAYCENKMPKISFFSQYMPAEYKDGMKISKFCSQVFKDSEFDIEFSKILQNRVVNGSIVVSIDPFDYATSATTMHGWTSCHRLWSSPGKCLCYALDEATLVAFRENGREYVYDKGVSVWGGDKFSFDFGKNAFTGNSKSWRQLVYFDKKTCAFLTSRTYPQEKDVAGISDKVREIIESALSEYLHIPDAWDNYGDLRRIAQEKYFGAQVYRDVDPAHYSDIANWEGLLRNYPHIKKALVAPSGTDMSKVRIEVGAKNICVKCGSEYNGEHAECGGC